LVPTLEASVQRFEQHRRLEILEAFLLLADRENRVLKAILQNPHDRAYMNTMALLSRSPRPGVMRLLVSFLDDVQLPNGVHQVLTRRRDVPFLRLLLKYVSNPPSPAVRANLRRVKSLSWLTKDLRFLAAFNEEEQCGVLQLVMASGLDRLQAFEVLRYLAKHANPGCRRACVAALADFRGAEANALVLQLLEDADAATRAEAAKQLRERGIPGALATLIELLDNPNELIREAARSSLGEFQFRRFLEVFDAMDEETRHNAGTVVRRVDPAAVELLEQELRATSRARRLRAVEMAIAMQVVEQVEATLIDLASDDDQHIRAEVLRALAERDSRSARRAVRERLLDKSAVVAEAAEAVLQAMAAKALAADPRPNTIPTAPPPEIAAPAALSESTL
jgi:HEAT repeat protein